MAVTHIGPMKLVLPVAYIAPMGHSASRPACFKGLFIGSSLTLVFLLSFPTPTNIIARFVKLCGLMPGKLLVRWRDWNHYPWILSIASVLLGAAEWQNTMLGRSKG